ncbi:hypothetical protein Moror_11608 [Moniliophthora roreri MCA 2997]|uniref:MYND-type domain-containing protein n=2 Tax=Moniliophthora roreri TaxID=221103 RepID=V2X4S4_MONRO|nr:hypothetical protein Moror_11608 [Moniliophthora roreri MCA 2997]KAI3617008.1 hypothetical protein WG66_004210 [Moniliophthora roreri]
MYGVVRFLDYPRLPATAPEDYPKIIKSGISEDGQHPKSPSITGPDGIVTLLYRIGKPEIIDRLLDFEKTKEFTLRVHTDEKDWYKDVYVKRNRADVEIGFINLDGIWAAHGVRYRIEKEPDSLYYYGKWTPISTADLSLGHHWGGCQNWIRKQGGDITKAIMLHRHYNRRVDIRWSGLSHEDWEVIQIDLLARRIEYNQEAEKQHEEYKAKKAQYLANDREADIWMDFAEIYRQRLACRADCDEKKPRLQYTKCKFTRYCSAECQKDDWKYHKTYCGKEEPIPEECKRYLEDML